MACNSSLPAVFKYPPDLRHPVYIGKKNEVLFPTLIPETGELLEPFRVACGQCLGCRLDYSRSWADRLVMESLTVPENYSWFVTLTYDPEFEPELYSFAADGKTVLSLQPDHFTLFFKRLRKYFADHYNIDGLRFYLAGEYGDKNARPHFHFILFGVDLTPFLDKWFINQNGDQIYKCEIISEKWSYGIVAVGRCTWQSCAYVARYVVKKRKGKDSSEYYAAAGLTPEYSVCSRRPGLGYDFYKQNEKKFIDGVTQYLPSVNGHEMPVRIPRYFLKLMEDEHPKEAARLKYLRQQQAIAADDIRLASSTLSDSEYFAQRERLIDNSAKKLLRNLE